MTNLRSVFGLVLLIFATLEIGYSANVSTYAASKQISIHRVCVMPAEAELNRYGMKGAQGMTKESEEWAGKLNRTISQAVTVSGTEVVADLSSESDENQRQVVVNLQQKYHTVAVLMEKKPKDVKKDRYTLGDDVALVPCSAKADAIVFTNGSGMLLTGGRKTFTAITSGATALVTAHSRFSLWISFVDSRTGEIIFLTHITSLGDSYVTTPDKAYGKLLEEEFKALGSVKK